MDGFSAWLNQLQWGKLLEMLLSAVSCLLCIVFHELFHGLAAFWMGDDTAKRSGRLSLNPLKHIDLVGLIMLFTVHFGWAKPVPVNMRRFSKPRLGMAVTALAGPAANLLLTILLIPAYVVSLFYVQMTDSIWLEYLTYFLANSLVLSTGLAIFNLFPIPPLDGSKVLFAFLPPSVYGKLMRYERFGMLLLVALLYFDVLDRPLTFLRDWLLNTLLTVIGNPVMGLMMG